MSVSGTNFAIHTNQTDDSQQISGRVSQLRENWRVFEDGALAERLQSEEIAAHLGGNRRRNHQIRDDFPRALEEQTKEKDEASRQEEEHRQRLKELENQDAEVAHNLQLNDFINVDTKRDYPQKIASDNRIVMSSSDMRHRDYEVERDRVFAQRLQRLEAEHSKRAHEKKKPAVPQPQGTGTICKPSKSMVTSSERINRDTPPLPVLANGDVLPSTNSSQEDLQPVTHEMITNHTPEDDVLPHVRGGIRYNDEQYLVKLARPAVVTSEPLYANNHPEHYAVSTKYPFANDALERSRGAVRKSKNYDAQQISSIEYGTGACIQSEDQCPEPVSGLLLDAAGLSQKDLAISKKAEEQLIQERRDADLARRLQEDLSFQSNLEHQKSLGEKAATEAEDFEYARALQEKEELKLRRAKERSKQRRKQREMSQQEQIELHKDNPEISEEQKLRRDQHQHEIFHGRTDSRISKKSQESSRDNLGPMQDAPDISPLSAPITNSSEDPLALTRRNLNISYDDSDSVTSVNPISSSNHPTQKSISPKEMKPPARKPYMNTGAIDLHQSEFAIGHHRINPSNTEDILFDNDEDDDKEPRYANVGPNGPLAAQLNYGGYKPTNDAKAQVLSNVTKKENCDEPIPPYMPMQQQTRPYNPLKYEKRDYKNSSATYPIQRQRTNR